MKQHMIIEASTAPANAGPAIIQADADAKIQAQINEEREAMKNDSAFKTGCQLWNERTHTVCALARLQGKLAAVQARLDQQTRQLEQLRPLIQSRHQHLIFW